ncbi:hypothetical protein GGR16_000220 [Chelatococcus caeni]|uniref:Uncharacterized protein n=1 Tax=Chelatococcus caeni TaxID=1348468 RepID=A0A840BR78_9HYPH|nr:hypothetical protein [Chelatococcus caeni]MBB4015214.1 hypothetical protein [Chelatococcus caeni]
MKIGGAIEAPAADGEWLRVAAAFASGDRARLDEQLSRSAGRGRAGRQMEPIYWRFNMSYRINSCSQCNGAGNIGQTGLKQLQQMMQLVKLLQQLQQFLGQGQGQCCGNGQGQSQRCGNDQGYGDLRLTGLTANFRLTGASGAF